MQPILRSLRLTMHRDGWWFVVPSIGLAVFFYVLWGLGAPFWLSILLTAALVFFFRDPDRIPLDGEQLVISAADGIFTSICPAQPPAELEMSSDTCLRISVFLNISDVHVTRIPVTGRIGAIVYRPGRKMSTVLDKSSADNERMAVRIDLPRDRAVAVCQIAGPIVRRVRCDLRIGAPVAAGDRYGLIRFGSRVDVYVPKEAVPRVKVGQRSIGGETIIAELPFGL